MRAFHRLPKISICCSLFLLSLIPSSLSATPQNHFLLFLFPLLSHFYLNSLFMSVTGFHRYYLPSSSPSHPESNVKLFLGERVHIIEKHPFVGQVEWHLPVPALPASSLPVCAVPTLPLSRPLVFSYTSEEEVGL